MDGFTHLHVHSHYSLLDGATTVKRLVDRAVETGMDSLALSDHGNLFGACDFYSTCKAADIKPVLGLEAYISPTSRTDRSMGDQRTACYHLLLLAMNAEGWLNLKRLSSRAYLEGFYYKPRIDRELLAEFNQGLICTTACLGGEVPAALLAGDEDKARRIAGEYRDIFGPERFFIEVQNNGIDEQTRVNPVLVKLADELGVGVVGTNDVHFLAADSKASHEVLTCIATGKTLEDSRLDYPDSLYLKSPREMREALKAFPGAADNTLKIAEMCDVEIDFETAYLPVFGVPEGKTDDEYLAEIAHEGLRARFDGKDVPQDYLDRLDHELQVINDKGYSSYFLIVNDFVEYARENDIPSAPRGSGVATLLGYSLKIAEVDPIRYGLLFERFTDPQRDEAPDLDIDICQEGRSKVIQYVRETYGHVAQIITYGTLKARAVLRDVGRVLGMELDEVDAICKLVPNDLKMTLDKALEVEPDLKQLYDTNPRVRAMVDHGRQLEGLCRHAGVHAAGVIVADVPLEEVVPLYKQGDSDVVTQWDGPTCEKVGLMKMDFLGLRTLTILQRAREMVREQTGEDIDPETVSLEDVDVFELFRDGHTDGVFQFESDGMKNVLQQMQPSRIEDLIAANAMYRPGPMELIPSYCGRKHGQEEVPSVHPLVDDLLAETYGIMAYQEQVMQVLNRLGKLPLNRALTLIKAISKKKEKVIASERPNFIQGAIENGIDEDTANGLFELILKFAGYGFNKAHSTRYAIVAYQTAWFKVHYPKQFLAATLTYEAVDTDKVVQYMAEAARMGIDIAPPDINTCGAAFAVDGNAVRFGLAAVKGVGHGAVEEIVRARQEAGGAFKNLYHFCEYVDTRQVNKGAIEALVKCGAFDALGANRAAMMAALDAAIDIGHDAAVNRRSGQLGLFGDAPVEAAPQFPDVEPWSEGELLAAEKETLGFFVSSHPLVKYGRELTGLSWPDGVTLGKLDQQPETFPHGQAVRVGCMIAEVRPTVTKKKGEKMARLVLEDVTGKYEAVVFPRRYETLSDIIAPDALVFVTGKMEREFSRPSIIVEEITPIDEALQRYTAAVELDLPPGDADLPQKIHEILSRHPGQRGVIVRVRPTCRPDLVAIIRAGRSARIAPNRECIEAVEDLLGDQRHIRLVPARVKLEERSNCKRRATGTNGHNKGPASEAVTRFN
ncbi:MAG: DNA polymerase III subunit alpha [Planctomycetes bacterium]|jgi:DNA polymerase-3 subunit alpha|nr:DNA polymerase III subunit alpha [Phycisphaerae bacterium]NBB95291.1 DNA polymerase III subunit alpha [Planctomycetota bacterium]